MAIVIKRGLSTARTGITPAEGELIYTTDTKLVYVGDGSTAGGVPVYAPARITASQSTSNIANNDSENINITGFKSYILYKVQTSAAAWVRIYADSASRTADATRTETEDPGVNSGVIAEVITSGAQTLLITPAALGFNNESPATTAIPIAVKNKSGSSTSITVTLTLLQLEN
jgi:hypothetical protein